ncbi:MAG: UDP-N-acetylmuramoyl-L-alanine--D-glutamate ligase [Thermoanaerobaculia bacterium]
MSAMPGHGRRQTGDGEASPAREMLPEKVAILGFARSGRALAEALCDRGVAVSVGDDKPESAFPEAHELRERGVAFFFGGPKEALLEGAGWLAISPGVPLTAPVVQAARRRRVPVLAEFEIAWRIAESEAAGENRWVAVTGTNGKSTTTAWIAEALRRAGRPVALAGNIGVPLSAFLSDRSGRDFVCELSSFQLETVERFAPQVAVLTNITPDHLDRYPSFEAYARSKWRLFARQRPQDFSVVNADNPPSAGAPTPARRVPFSRAGHVAGGVWVEEGVILSEVRGERREVLAAERLALPGAHNLENALAVAAAALCLETPEYAIRDALTRFAGLPHRSELVAQARGVRWVDDSKGTNVDATRKCLEGFPEGSVILILGGRDKQGDFPSLSGAVARAARCVLTIGEAAEVIERALAGGAAIERCGTMENAVLRASEIARPGETVLLSPACASFDAYASYEERGRHFATLARAVAAKTPRKE